ncbi:hypothetical protein TRIATDRAFT_215066 [Trichoderma atroviride IMI 206040]|uniref:Uncharacterized protein n=1 Tax=Hypocrea atroviridis (strain ATCC 20476 / IMI 206040) TaxID=452589 RepID=G9NLP2_HYPAI|nr:uncharacterized protein TRIATDRAFT_215066 [Trichoderma atroviride IMI 206040]EHK48803.1 hypothetical protein TRIATDRAFT_215066 [Trichoderma atroviride IMI 206040]
MVSYLRYQTLHDVAGVKLVFVDCISLHLDFDEKSRELRIFRFPSLCKLLCHSREYRWLYYDPRPSASQTSQIGFETGHSQASDMYREVLLSYRLIFGQDKKSWKAWRNFYKAQNVPPGIEDPLLRRLCGQDCRYETTYEEIKAPDVAAQYSASEDFPFWGARLLKIQQFVVNKNPSDWKTLWNDRRDVLRFYTFWAVVVVGVMSLTLSVIQSIEGGIQVAYAIKAYNGQGKQGA